MDIFIVLALIVMSGLFSGLTIGLMGLSYTEVKRAADLGNKFAIPVLSLIKESNLLLVTLLLGNTAVNASLSIFLSGLVGPGLVAGITSTTLILIFGEILPASLLSKHALRIGSIMAPFVLILIKVTYIISKPITIILDKYVGVVSEIYLSRKELIHIIDSHESSNESDIDRLDKQTLKGTLLLSNKVVGDHMTRGIFVIPEGTVITFDVLEEIRTKGFTRIPIMNKDHKVTSILHSKDLLNYNLNDRTKVENVRSDKDQHRIFNVFTEAKLDNVLSHMIEHRLHIAIVKSFDTVVGVITMEDIIEELLLHEIEDEFDK